MAPSRREVVQFAAAANPSLAWVKQQIGEATPWERTPRFLLHDNGGIYGQFGTPKHAGDSVSGRTYRRALDMWLHQVLGVDSIPNPCGAPNAAAHVERFMGTLRLECLDHFIFVIDGRLRRAVVELIGYYNNARPHQAINGFPVGGPGQSPELAAPRDDATHRLVAHPILGGLHRDYWLAAQKVS